MRPHQWREHRVGGDWQGTVRLRFGSEHEVLRAVSLLAECAVDIEGRCARLEIHYVGRKVAFRSVTHVYLRL